VLTMTRPLTQQREHLPERDPCPQVGRAGEARRARQHTATYLSGCGTHPDAGALSSIVRGGSESSAGVPFCCRVETAPGGTAPQCDVDQRSAPPTLSCCRVGSGESVRRSFPVWRAGPGSVRRPRHATTRTAVVTGSQPDAPSPASRLPRGGRGRRNIPDRTRGQLNYVTGNELGRVPGGHEVVPALQRLRLLAEGGVGALHAMRQQPARLGGPRATQRRNGGPPSGV
jgi:hypothetical protein